MVTEGSETHHRHAGDSLGFGLPADVVIANRTAHPCTYLVALARS
ncbi:hypothetical protein [Deinococcus sp.]|nr:hypothetical protein [Deinococcus sp.]